MKFIEFAKRYILRIHIFIPKAFGRALKTNIDTRKL